jgi:diguanylate cyclase (GGDEF)-like protein/PAS domain S-box-containing protein
MATLEVSRDMVCLCIDGIITDINSAGLALLNASSPEEVVGQPFHQRVGGDYAAVVEDLLGLREIELTAFPIQVRRLDGSTIEMELLVHPARELGHAFAFVMGRDISRQGRLARNARESEDRFRLLVENSMHMIAHCYGDRVIYMNRAGVAMLHAEDTNCLSNLMVADIFHGQYREIFANNLSALLDEGTVIPVHLARFSGEGFDAQILVTRLPSRGPVPEFMLEARDVTGHNRAVAALRQMNETLEQKVADRTREVEAQRGRANEARLFVESLLEAVPNALWWKDSDGCFRGYNRAFRTNFGIGPEDWVGKCMGSLLDPAYVAVSQEADRQALAGVPRVQFEAQLAFASGARHDVVVSKTAYLGREGRADGVIGVMLDITDRKHMEAELRRFATTDALTGVFNRRHFLDCATIEVERSRRHHRTLSVMMLDIDHFKRINDTYGHPVGDEAIRGMARACLEIIRTEDLLGRLGGEEFAVLLPETGREAAMAVAERLRQGIATVRILTDKGEVSFTASIGVTELLPSDNSAELLLSRADLGLYDAKHGGRNRVMPA